VLKQRVITALVLIPLTLWMIFTLSTAWLALVFGVLVLGAGHEWARLSGFGRYARLAYVLVLAVIGLALYLLTISRGDGEAAFVVLPVFIVGVLWWCWALYELVRYQKLERGVLGSPSGRAVAGLLMLVPAWLAVTFLHFADPRAPAVLLFLLLLVWLADSGAYFAGRTWGKTKLAAHVSPGKTVEGVIGGVAAVLALAYVAGAFVWHLPAGQLMVWLIIAVVSALFSVVGDLMESKAKRLAGVKDSGRILPGHGGLFDRIDGLTAAAPVFALSYLVSIEALR
jgi:phosphatidate cytidylyltransferase